MHDIQQQDPSLQQGVSNSSQQWLQEDGSNITGIEQKLEKSDHSRLPRRHLVVRRKPKIKEDGPLTVICEFAVEHQIGEKLVAFFLL